MYASDSGTYEDEGYSLSTNVSGQGLLPPGAYTVEVISVYVGAKDGSSYSTLVLLEKARGVHTETIPGDYGLKELDIIRVEIGMSEGIYIKKVKGSYAAFCATTNKQLTQYSTNILDVIDLEGMPIATPTIKRINDCDILIPNPDKNAQETAGCSDSQGRSP